MAAAIFNGGDLPAALFRPSLSHDVSDRLSGPALSKTDAAVHDAAVGEDSGCSEIARAVTANKTDHAGNFLRARHSSQRYCRVELGELGRIVDRAAVDRCLDGTRTHPDNPNVVSSEFDARRARQQAHTAFGQAIRGVSRHWPVLVHRGNVDNAAAASLLDHLPGHNLRAEKGALEIDGHYPVVLVLSGVEDRAAGFDTGVVHHDVDPTERAHCFVDQHLQIRELAHIGFDANRLNAELADLLLERLSRLRMTHIVNHDIGVLPGEFENDRLAYPTVPAGDDRDFAIQ